MTKEKEGGVNIKRAPSSSRIWRMLLCQAGCWRLKAKFGT